MKIEKILIVDDEEVMREFLGEAVERAGMEAFTAPNGTKALEILKNNTIDLVLTDMQMPKISGLELIPKIKKISPKTLIVVVTGYGSIDNAVEAMQLGAFHYLLKPLSPEALEAILEKANEHYSLMEENDYLRETATQYASSKVVGRSPAILNILETVKRVAKSNASIFIHGESGTGKEIIAQTIHNESHRAERPFIKVNCAAIPETLIESEFFGHEKGAFTGANSRRLGRFELANGGSLLLDEISEIPLSLQAKLLRVTQEKEFDRIGGTKPIHVDVRLISTSNKNIDELIEKKFMREDLFYRLNVVPIHISPLRERVEDIIPLSEYFVKNLCAENNRKTKQLSAEAEEKLLNYSWPGNVRELQNIIERAIVTMNPHDLEIREEDIHINTFKPASPTHQERQLLKGMTLKELEKKLIVETLQSHGKNPEKAAQSLGIPEAILRNKLREYEIE